MKNNFIHPFFLFFLCVCILLPNAWAASGFIVKRIEVEGLTSMPQETVISSLPIKVGDAVNAKESADIVRTLYQTGLFDTISLSRRSNTLIINATERPMIGFLKVKGNSAIPTDKLNTVLQSLNIAEGRVYDPAQLAKVRSSLLNQYYQLGHYNAHVNVIVTPLPRDRVAVHLDISEGLTSKIKGITIIGNHVYSEHTLLKQIDVTTSGLLTFFTQKDRYSEDRIDQSAEQLRDYYLDHGYIRASVRSSQAQISPDKKFVYITMIVYEGDQYIVDGVDIQGNLILPKNDYMKEIVVQPGQLFSRAKIMASERNITRMLGEKGYMFANINLQPQINDQTHRVFLVLNIDPGPRTYVRHVTFSENMRTNDIVLRREITQMEAAPASATKLDESKRNLSMLPYIKNVDMSVNPVPEHKDQVDVNYKVEEANTANASFKVGYSQLYGVILGAGWDQKNFLGTGNTLGIDLSHSEYQQYYGINYTDPYYTESGISRTFTLAMSRTDPRGASIDAGYTTDEYDAGVMYGIPIGQQTSAFNRIETGATYKNTLVNPTSLEPTQVSTFLAAHGRRAQELDLALGYSHDGRDRAIFPTSGTLQTLFFDYYAPLDTDSLSFYQVNYHGRWYEPLTESFIFLTRADVGYGNGIHGINDYPFYRNFFAGGIDSVRGFQGYTLGPRDSFDNPIGGNILVDASEGFIFPNHISDNLRTSVFVDAGNVYSSGNNTRFGGQSTNSGPIRYSVGLEADVITPFGPIELSLAKPFLRKHDRNEPFQFALGANF